MAELTTISQYAKQNGISYQAINQQIKRYESELKEHIIKDGKTRLLDEEAVAFLDSHRVGTKVSVVSGESVSKVEQLEKEKAELLTKLNVAYEALLAEKDKNVALLEKNNELQLLIAQKPEEKTEEKTEAVPEGNRFKRAWKELMKK